MEVHEKPQMANLRGSFSRSSDSRSSSNQAYVDLLKASWILYEVILKDENLTLLLTDENRKLFYNLSDVNIFARACYQIETKMVVGH